MMANEKTFEQYLQQRKQEKHLIIFTQISLLAGFLLLWEIAAQKEWIDAFLFSNPTAIAQIFWQYFTNGTIWAHIGITMWETLLGFFLGTVFGLLLAVLMWWFPLAAKILDPFLVVLNALPKTALAPMVIVWFGAGISGIVAVAVFISIIVTVLSAYSYFINMDENKIKMLHSFGATKGQIFYKLILPANLGNMVNIAKINIGLCLIGVIVGEFLVSRYGIGYLIVYGNQVFRLDLVMMGVVILAVCAWGMNALINALEYHLKNH